MDGYEIDFLPVGEKRSGDAIAVRFGNLAGPRSEQTVIVIDGGFLESGDELVDHITRYYGTSHVDLVISTHPDADHAAGLERVLERCSVGSLWMHLPWEHTDDIARMFKDGRVTDASVSESLRRSLDNARSLEQIARRKRIPIVEPFAGTYDPSGKVYVLGPSLEFYERLLPDFRGTPIPKEALGILEKLARGAQEVWQRIAERWDIETLDDSGETSAENNSSAILVIQVHDGYLLFTGDAGIPALSAASDRLDALGIGAAAAKFIQVPHHGSRRNVGPTILDRLIGPRLAEGQIIKTAYVSAGSAANPKHPAKKVLNAFRRRGAPVYGTHGRPIRFQSNAPVREGWGPIDPHPFYTEVED